MNLRWPPLFLSLLLPLAAGWPTSATAVPWKDKALAFCESLLGLDRLRIPEVREANLGTVIPGYLGLPVPSQRQLDRTYVQYRIEAKQRLNHELAQLPLGEFGPEDLREKIARNEVMEELFVSTHQRIGLQKATAARVTRMDKRLARIFLVSEGFPVVERDFAKEASLFQYSFAGEFAEVPVARRVYLTGGFDKLCLANSILGLVASAQRQGLKEMTFHIFLNEIYFLENTDAKPTLSKQGAGLDQLVINFFGNTDRKLTIANRRMHADGKTWSADLTLRDQFKIHLVLDLNGNADPRLRYPRRAAPPPAADR